MCRKHSTSSNQEPKKAVLFSSQIKSTKFFLRLRIDDSSRRTFKAPTFFDLFETFRSSQPQGRKNNILQDSSENELFARIMQDNATLVRFLQANSLLAK